MQNAFTLCLLALLPTSLASYRVKVQPIFDQHGFATLMNLSVVIPAVPEVTRTLVTVNRAGAFQSIRDLLENKGAPLHEESFLSLFRDGGTFEGQLGSSGNLTTTCHFVVPLCVNRSFTGVGVQPCLLHEHDYNCSFISVTSDGEEYTHALTITTPRAGMIALTLA